MPFAPGPCGLVHEIKMKKRNTTIFSDVLLERCLYCIYSTMEKTLDPDSCLRRNVCLVNGGVQHGRTSSKIRKLQLRFRGQTLVIHDDYAQMRLIECPMEFACRFRTHIQRIVWDQNIFSSYESYADTRNGKVVIGSITMKNRLCAGILLLNFQTLATFVRYIENTQGREHTRKRPGVPFFLSS